MNPSSFVEAARREVPLLRVDDDICTAAEAVIAAGVPALPVVDERGRFAGVFGEREFVHAVFPPYFDALGSARFVPHSLDHTLEVVRATDPVSAHMTPDHVEVGADPSDAELAEIFLHHRVLIVPIVEDGRVTGIVTRSDFFRALTERFRELSG
jgi:CBS domain-containing protein